MDMLSGDEVDAAGLTDWRRLAQGLHARYRVDDFAAAARFVTAVAEAGDAAGHHPRVTIGPGQVDLKLSSEDAVYREDDGTEHVVEWMTARDVDLARRITEVAAAQGLTPDPAGVSVLELGLDTPDASRIAPVWAALLTGDPASRGRGTPGDEVRDAAQRIPNLWFDDPGEGASAQRFHVEVYVAPEVAAERIAAAVTAGARVVDDSEAPRLVVLADPDGNRGVVCAPAATG
ncbi:VOC family protein [Phycicoccus avicenniae]|uniref:VOC family protein n=1 Tax=Phycicoccus avicenniae TaxID=2828860 RepID=UPI003D2C1EC3